MEPGEGAWADDQQPLDEAATRCQVDGLLDLLGPPPKRVLDLGCGSGRVLVPLAARGHHVVGVDRDRRWLAACAGRLKDVGAEAELACASWHDFDPAGRAPFDIVCCLGYAFTLIVEVDEAVGLLGRAGAALRAGGAVVIDDIPGDLWPEVTAGNWQTGVSEDGSSQLIWDPDDAVFAVRHGGDVDATSWTRRPSDTPVRLWTRGALRLAAGAAGLSAPERQGTAGLLVMRRQPE